MKRQKAGNRNRKAEDRKFARNILRLRRLMHTERLRAADDHARNVINFYEEPQLA